MKRESRKLVLEQLDRKLQELKPIATVIMPGNGWVHAIRTSLGMSLRQLGSRMKITPQSVKEMEIREADGSITLRRLREAAAALDMDFVYVLIPREHSLEATLEARAMQVARMIVHRTSATMELEQQDVSKERIEKAIQSKKEELIRIVPRYLWD